MSNTTTSGQPPAEEILPGAAAQEKAQEKAEEMLRKHDVSSRFRTNLGWWGWLIAGISIAFTLYHLYAALERPFNAWRHAALHVAGATSLIFLLYPASKRLLDTKARSMRTILLGGGKGVPWYDAILSLAALFCSLYIFFDYDRLVSNRVQILGYSDLDHIVATVGLLLVLEATRRSVGIPIVVIAGVAILYAVFGQHSPIFPHTGLSWNNFTTTMFLSNDSGVFGTPIRVSSNFIFLFLFFATMLIHTNIGAFFNDLAFRATGRMTGGPAKAAVVASGLQGMVSGSSVANVAASGSFTIPMMKKNGFKPHFAAAVEATASTGGQIMPPIMGAAAFIMAQNIPGLEYNELIVIAIIPALLYFTGAFLAVHFEAKRQRIAGLPVSQLPSVRSIMVRIDLLLPLIVIIGTLLIGMSPMRAALMGILTAFVLSFLRPSTRLGFKGILNLLSAAARVALPVIAACAAAGIVAGTVTSTGLGGRLGRGLMEIAGGNFALILIMVMVACIVLGMGLPTTANYVVTATVAAPILYTNFDVPLIAAHMFVFFFGILADVTPPVCLATFAGAGIAGANPMRAGVTAMRVAVAGFLIPYAFILQPAMLLEGPWFDTVISVVSAVLGMAAVAAAMAGYFMWDTRIYERVPLLAGGLLLVYPDTVISLAGLAIVIAVGVMQRIRRPAEDPLLVAKNAEREAANAS